MVALLCQVTSVLPWPVWSPTWQPLWAQSRGCALTIVSALGFCSGAVAGLVAITPASGFVGPAPAVAIGFLGAVACNMAVHLKHWLKYDDVADVFAVHGVGGYVGSLLTGIFSEAYIAHLDGATVIEGGWMNRHFIQLAIN